MTGSELFSKIKTCQQCELYKQCNGPVTPHISSLANVNILFAFEKTYSEDDMMESAGSDLYGDVLKKLYKRHNIAITNLLKCHFDKTSVKHFTKCMSLFFDEIATLKPNVIVVFGTNYIHKLLNIKKSEVKTGSKYYLNNTPLFTYQSLGAVLGNNIAYNKLIKFLVMVNEHAGIS